MPKKSKKESAANAMGPLAENPYASSVLENWEIGKTLGQGAFGRVRVAKEKKEENWYALKILRKSALVYKQQVYQIQYEKNLLVALAHPFMVNAKGCFHDSRYCYFVLELVNGGEFFTHLHDKVPEGKFDNEVARYHVMGITTVFEYMHGLDVIYRDLKPENVLLNVDGYLKICDMGAAKVIGSAPTYTACGTPEYTAPEVLTNAGYAKSVDWWTLGIFTYEMLIGVPPFMSKNPKDLNKMIADVAIDWKGDGKLQALEKEALKFLQKIIVKDSKTRYGCSKAGAKVIKKDKWFADVSWDDFENRAIDMPYKPKVKDEHEVDSNFIEEYPDSKELPAEMNPKTDPFVGFENIEAVDLAAMKND